MCQQTDFPTFLMVKAFQAVILHLSQSSVDVVLFFVKIYFLQIVFYATCNVSPNVISCSTDQFIDRQIPSAWWRWVGGRLGGSF